MAKDRYLEIKESVLDHIQTLFDEMEEEMAMSHQEKYALLEDSFENATDEDELKVAFEQWYAEHSEDLNLDFKVDELWDKAVGGELSYDNLKDTEDEEETSEDFLGLKEEDEDDEKKHKNEYSDGNDEY